MGVIQDKLKPIEEYMAILSRDTIKGWYEMEVGMPANWVYSENKDIKCEVLAEDDNYKLIKLSPKNVKITADDLVDFFEIIIQTNEKIAQKEEEFKKRMEKIKEELEGEAKKFYEELDSLKENSFKNVTVRFENKLDESKTSDSIKKKRGRPKSNTENPSSPVIITNSDDEEGKETNV